MAASIVRSTANRAVHLKFTPRPSNLGESREILRLISQFGEVEYFKNFKYDTLSSPTTAMVIFREEEAAQYCLSKSIIRFRMGRAPVGEDFSAESTAHHTPSQREPASSTSHRTFDSPARQQQTRQTYTDSLPTPPDRPVQMPFDAPRPPLIESRIFEIQTSPARMHFRDQINRGHYHGGFPLDTKSIAQHDLVKRVPYAGLSCVDWKAEEKPWRLMLRERKAEEEYYGRRKTLGELYKEGPSANAP